MGNNNSQRNVELNVIGNNEAPQGNRITLEEMQEEFRQMQDKQNNDMKKIQDVQEELKKIKAQRNDAIDAIEKMQKQMEAFRENKVPLPTPWREVENDVFSQTTKEQLLGKVDAIVPPTEAINFIVIGKIGAGKSSFVNTLMTVLNNTGRICTIQGVYNLNEDSVTQKFFEVNLKTFRDGKKIRIYDSCGFIKNDQNILYNDLEKAIAGHMTKDYQFLENVELDTKSEWYRKNPSISDKMHCVLFVVNADKLEHDPSITTMQRRIALMNIPTRLILTKIDKLDLCSSGDLSGIFISKHPLEKVKEAKTIFDFRDCQIHPIANYVEGTTQNIAQDVLTLLACIDILEEAVMHIKNKI